MKTIGMPAGMWALFVGSFKRQLTETLGYEASRAKEIAGKAKGEHKLKPASRLMLEQEHLKVWQKKKEKKVCVYLELDTCQDKTFIYRDFIEYQTQIYKLIDSTKF